MKSKILEFLALGLLALPSVGHAALVTISGQGSADGDWNVTTVSATYSGFAGAGTQVWWGNASLANVFSQTLAGALGYPNKFVDNFGGVSPESYAPLFAYQTSGGGCCGLLFDARAVRDNGNPTLFQDIINRGIVYKWAVAERVTTSPPPVPLPAAAWLLLSGLAGLGVVGRRKRA